MSIKDLIKNKVVEQDATPSNCLYTSVKGVLGSNGAFMPKQGEVFCPANQGDIEILEYFVSVGIVEKMAESEEVEE